MSSIISMIPPVGRPGGRDKSCPACRGRGWKFRGFRQSVSAAGDAGERALLGRVRIPCITCTPPREQASTGE